MAKVIKREGENIESLLRRFKRKVNDEMILADMKKHEEYVGPAEKRRKKKKEAQRKRDKFERIQNRFKDVDPKISSMIRYNGGKHVQQ